MDCYISHLQPVRPLVTPSVRSGCGVAGRNLKEKEKPPEITSPKRLLIWEEGPVGRGPLACGLNLTVPVLNSRPARVELAADEIALRGKESSGGDNELWKTDFHLNIISLTVPLLVLEKQFHQKSAGTARTETQRCRGGDTDEPKVVSVRTGGVFVFGKLCVYFGAQPPASCY